MVEPTLPGYWSENLRRSFRDWEGREAMAGLLIILVTAIGYGAVFNEPSVAKWSAIIAVAYVGMLLAIVSPWQMWRDSQTEIAQFKERLRPRLAFVLEPDATPYVALFKVTRDEVGRPVDREIRLCRIGIRNDSAVIIKKVRVVLESTSFIVADKDPVPAQPSSPALIEHALNVMGIDRKDGRVDVAPGDRPTAYIDVVEQFENNRGEPDSWISLCYSTGHRTPMYARAKWVLTLRVEGGGTYARQRFVIESTEDAKSIELRPYGHA